MTMQLSGLHPDVRDRAEIALEWAQVYHIPVTITSTLRTWAEQTKLRAQYEQCVARGEEIYPTNPEAACRYPANQPGDSSHNYGLAWDSWVPEEHWPNWTIIRRWLGFHVPDNDRVHAEVPSWRIFTTSLRRG